MLNQITNKTLLIVDAETGENFEYTDETRQEVYKQVADYMKNTHGVSVTTKNFSKLVTLSQTSTKGLHFLVKETGDNVKDFVANLTTEQEAPVEPTVEVQTEKSEPSTSYNEEENDMTKKLSVTLNPIGVKSKWVEEAIRLHADILKAVHKNGLFVVKAGNGFMDIAFEKNSDILSVRRLTRSKDGYKWSVTPYRQAKRDKEHQQFFKTDEEVVKGMIDLSKFLEKPKSAKQASKEA